MVSYKNDWKEDCQKLLRRDEDLNWIQLASLFEYHFNLSKNEDFIMMYHKLRRFTCSWIMNQI